MRQKAKKLYASPPPRRTPIVVNEHDIHPEKRSHAPAVPPIVYVIAFTVLVAMASLVASVLH